MQRLIVGCFFALFALIVVAVWVGGSPLMATVLAVSFGGSLAYAETVIGQ